MIHREVLATCLALTNLGYDAPDVFKISKAMKVVKKGDLDGAVVEICAPFGSFHSFTKEAAGFMEMFENKTDHDIHLIWPHRAAMIHHCDTNINID